MILDLSHTQFNRLNLLHTTYILICFCCEPLPLKKKSFFVCILLRIEYTTHFLLSKHRRCNTNWILRHFQLQFQLRSMHNLKLKIKATFPHIVYAIYTERNEYQTQSHWNIWSGIAYLKATLLRFSLLATDADSI